MLVRVANNEDPDQTFFRSSLIWVCTVFLRFFAGHWCSKVSDFNSFLAIGDFCRLLITFSNSLDPDQAKQNVVPDLDQNFVTLL